MMVSTLVVACSSAVATGQAFWVELDNSVNPANGNPTGLDDGSYDGTVYRTFDLFVILPPRWDGGPPETNGVNAADFGIAGPNTGLSTDGVFYQTPEPIGSDSVVANETATPFEDRVFYDTAVALEDASISFALPMIWDPAGVTGAFFLPGGRAYTGGGDHFFIARITISADASELGGQCFVGDEQVEPCTGPFCVPHPSTGIHNIPNAFQELECLGDITWDGVVDTSDIARLLAAFGSGWGDADFDPRADFTRDGVVDTADLARLLGNFGQACP